ncbi:lmo0937 family membrane protein [Alloacidobacterium sp.]|uniref:lmo0937 family membrane protein n=1 Tax=Alloacidobacterium sp. TaxID=2951999 RepID=UPI002D223598|nr:lmo0937 family membrane protein [Alloacidobacterium sp.]HYK34738.1 lmo0937 family membrane protein [Alloacidobacterium sp.]
MFLLFALILVLAWIGAFVMFHVAGFLIHLLLIFAIISVIVHFARGARAKA